MVSTSFERDQRLTRDYELCPLGGFTHSFHNSEQGWTIMHFTYERRSLLMGIPHGKPLRREIRSENHTRPFQNGVIAIDGPHPGALSLELLWAERSGKGVQTKPRPSLYHSIQRQWSWMSQREPEGTVRCLTSRKQIHLSLAQNSPYLLHHLGVEHPFPGPQPLPWKDVYSHI